MGISKQCKAKVIKYLDENFTVGATYVGEDIGKYILVMDNCGKEHPIPKYGVLIQHFEICEV